MEPVNTISRPYKLLVAVWILWAAFAILVFIFGSPYLFNTALPFSGIILALSTMVVALFSSYSSSWLTGVIALLYCGAYPIAFYTLIAFSFSTYNDGDAWATNSPVDFWKWMAFLCVLLLVDLALMVRHYRLDAKSGDALLFMPVVIPTLAALWILWIIVVPHWDFYNYIVHFVIPTFTHAL